jgi:hypothetical protein
MIWDCRLDQRFVYPPKQRSQANESCRLWLGSGHGAPVHGVRLQGLLVRDARARRSDPIAFFPHIPHAMHTTPLLLTRQCEELVL